ncbi:hypothetical protein AMAG_19175 [Allomyces macrogynus ATCC 38327]|uniref:Uncharacterized protein n=1 Tax=Allomyces macrogynus (strain ATCC 38327) TaxID=578462 RepID=A0A0L0SPR1_ALLM3|nr:hypothetical protein AMAG_19175 [Allomyces macrogynus ATCC 38327]|eukprot:KNE64508.1 hypothetical protein AMAG_19175 [Allomyces macrogynus ATCC 38327]
MTSAPPPRPRGLPARLLPLIVAAILLCLLTRGVATQSTTSAPAPSSTPVDCTQCAKCRRGNRSCAIRQMIQTCATTTSFCIAIRRRMPRRAGARRATSTCRARFPRTRRARSRRQFSRCAGTGSAKWASSGTVQTTAPTRLTACACPKRNFAPRVQR